LYATAALLVASPVAATAHEVSRHGLPKIWKTNQSMLPNGIDPEGKAAIVDLRSELA